MVELLLVGRGIAFLEGLRLARVSILTVPSSRMRNPSVGPMTFIDISGMSVADALTRPIDIYENRRKSSDFATITFNGETLTYDQWGPRVGLLQSTIASRTKRGWSPKEALTTPARDMGRRKT